MIHVHQDPVVITRVGATTPLGGDVPTTWDALLAGQSGVRRLTQESRRCRAAPVRSI